MQESKADTGMAAAAAAAGQEQSTFESQPQASRAFIGHGTQGASTGADAPSVFESAPSKSTAAVTAVDEVTTAEAPSVFESKPRDSKASAKAGVDHASESE